MAHVTARLMLVLLAITLGLLAGECMVRIIAPQALWFPWGDELDGVLVPRPSVSGRHSAPGAFDLRESIGSERFRGPVSYTTTPAPDVIRIAMLGDSNTYGVGASDDETYPAQLQRLLRQAGFNAEVINAGVPGTGTGEQILYFEHWVQRFHPQLVVLTVAANDPSDDADHGFFIAEPDEKIIQRSRGNPNAHKWRLRQWANALPGYGWLAQHSQLLGLIRAIMSHQVAVDSAPAVRNGNQLAMQRLTAAELRYLKESTHRSGARLVVVFVPGAELVYQPNSAEAKAAAALVKIVQQTCEQDEIPFLDSTAPLRARAAAFGNQSLYYSGSDLHPRPEAYAVIAATVADRLRPVFSQR